MGSSSVGRCDDEDVYCYNGVCVAMTNWSIVKFVAAYLVLKIN